MFYVYFGHVNEDNYDSSEGPIHELKVLKSKEEVLKLYKEWMDPEEIGGHDECSHCFFTVIEGKERKMVSVTKVTDWELEA